MIGVSFLYKIMFDKDVLYTLLSSSKVMKFMQDCIRKKNLA